ncbi:DUF418 domain-containing protein [Terrimonas sp. NA20]|uniref:DUF418 domain-containing protein n=1 Tax=Terrimonas ginsenosidimutans TaxID=2908004 RepID=A0ABS9KN27_9BACT|nr:DUF418 domain-containing protein [Terrimonas ginsenosidimutans]MCG2613727.1 DUF418 domain-containing protein [Terrimonas ginsenosidimutans]
MPQLTPIASQDREQFMDVLRGIAILGIFIANLAGFSWYTENPANTGPWLLPEQDHTMEFLHHMFIEGKFYSIFSLLFGWGIALQLKRAADKGVDAAPLVRRRLGWMLVLGAIHLMLWPGDIVFFYALLGFILLWMRKLSNKAMIITGIILILSPIVLYAAKSYWVFLNAPAGLMYETGGKVMYAISGKMLASDQDIAAYLKQASWGEALQANTAGFFFRYGYLFFVSRIPKVLGIFLIGYALGRSGFYNRIQQHKKVLYMIIATGVVIGLPANYLLARYMSYCMADYWQLNTKGLYQTIAYAFGVAPLALAYVAALMLLFQNKAVAKLMSVVAPVGKMAFSNYLLQSVIGSVVFLGAGFNYIGEVGPFYYTIFGVLVFIGQIILSRLWLRYFNYGPIEYLWRSATYGKWQQMRKTSIAV